MPDILTRHGIQVRNGRCRAVCHDGSNYTAKVSRDMYYCFKCNTSMDIFDLTMHFYRCGFKEAMELLGGGEKPSFRVKYLARKKKREDADRASRKRIQDKKRKELLLVIRAYRNLIMENEPFSDLWCYCQNKLPYQEYLLEELENDKA